MRQGRLVAVGTAYLLHKALIGGATRRTSRTCNIEAFVMAEDHGFNIVGFGAVPFPGRPTLDYPLPDAVQPSV